MKKKFTTRDLILCALFTALSAIGAFIRIPVPLVPFTLQITFTTLAGLLLGSKKGAISVAVYVLMGLIGIPVFTQGGGFSYVLKPSFGFLVAFIIGAFVTGLIVEKKQNPSFLRILGASFAGRHSYTFWVRFISILYVTLLLMHLSASVKQLCRVSCLSLRVISPLQSLQHLSQKELYRF